MVLSAIVGPAITGVKKGSELTSISYGLSEALQQARTHAMARNTHVYVGIGATTGGSVQGIVLGAAASKDGLAAVDAGALQVSRLAPITRALRFDGVRLSNLSGKSGAEYAGAD
jgi:Tfp pilus assembly protein FimT